MANISMDGGHGQVDFKVWVNLMRGDNLCIMNRLKRNLAYALRNDITERQRQYMEMYYINEMTMKEIGDTFGVNKSTVSRTLKRGRKRLYKYLKYGASNLLEQAES